MDIAEENTREFCKKIDEDPRAVKTLQEWLPGTKNAEKLQEAYKKIMEKYRVEMMSLASKEFQEGMDVRVVEEAFQLHVLCAQSLQGCEKARSAADVDESPHSALVNRPPCWGEARSRP